MMNLEEFREKMRNRQRTPRWRDRERLAIEPRSEIEQTISCLLGQVREYEGNNRLPLEEAVTIYLTARELRHELWTNAFEKMSGVKNAKFSDVSFSRFCDEKLGIPVESIPVEIRNKTPDILMQHGNGRHVILGDITVSSNVQQANKRKTEKYFPLCQFLRANGQKVRQTNLVIDANLRNQANVITAAIDSDIIAGADNEVLRRSFAYHEVCNNIMEMAREKSENVREFNNRIDREDRMTDDEGGIKLPGYFNNLDMPTYDVTQSEDHFAEELREATNRLYEEGFFDTDQEKIKKAFDKLLNNSHGREFMEPKSILKAVYNLKNKEARTGHDLIEDYIKDIHLGQENDIQRYLISLLPTTSQNSTMKKAYEERSDTSTKKYKDETLKVYGPHQYTFSRNSGNIIMSTINAHLKKGKNDRNEKKEPKTLDPSRFDTYVSDVNEYMTYLGEMSNKQPFLDETWNAKTNIEMDTSAETRELYNKVRKSNGAQLCHALSNMYLKIMHMRTRQGTKDNIFTPPNGAFIMIIPNDHAPVTSKNCDLPFIFVTRQHKDDNATEPLETRIEYEYRYEGDEYIYFVSKLSRLNINKISHWDQAGYKIVACATYILATCPSLLRIADKVIGILSMLLIDSHQKTSEYLDLLKYVAFMPFADVSRLDKLIEDKMDLLIKTRLDVWMLYQIKGFMNELSDIDALEAKKPKIIISNGKVMRESLGMNMKLASFIDRSIRHQTVEQYIEEISMVYIIRPKQLYGSQFMDRSINSTAEWNLEFEEEKKKYGEWVTTGYGEGDYPFESKFSFNTNAILHALEFVKNRVNINPRDVNRKLGKTLYNSYMHHNCSLRGATKSASKRKNNADIHTTSLQACLDYYRDNNYNEESCTVSGVAMDFDRSNEPMQFSMSEKEQRGGGRPIATPTLGAKAALMLIEKPEQAIGTYMPNNIIVEGKNKLQEQAEAYKKLITEGSINGKKCVYQLTEDQTKFSENDNPYKYLPYVAMNDLLPRNVRALQYRMLNKLQDREHLVKRLPTSLRNNPDLQKYITNGENGIKATIGWPQGMLNFISTSVHSIADYWITHMFNKTYNFEQVITEGRVHSDDSWVAVACKNLETFKKFAIFRMLAKRYFCLKLNDKKVWGSKYLGELVSNYNINGNVHLSIAKMVSNSFGNLTFQNWVMDVNNQISCIQQCYRAGARLPTLILMSTILKQQLIGSYNVKGKQLEMLGVLPIELGGFPNLSAFEMGINGVNSHYDALITHVQRMTDAPSTRIILKALRLSRTIAHFKKKGSENPEQETLSSLKLDTILSQDDDPDPENNENILNVFNNDDYENIALPSRGEIFSCIRYLMPKSTKIAKTVEEIRQLPFESDGLEMLITKPIKLADALGHLKGQLSTKLYELAAEKYTQNSRRLAISQAIQSSGKTIRILGSKPMSTNEMLECLSNINVQPDDVRALIIAFSDDTSISLIANNIVYSSDITIGDKDKRKIINRMPEVEDKFRTVCDFRNVLLYKIDKTLKTDYLDKNGYNIETVDMLEIDCKLIEKSFDILFSYHDVRKACNLIMQMKFSRTKARLWMQPYLKTNTLITFLEDLYGVTLDDNMNYVIKIRDVTNIAKKIDEEMVDSIYTVEVLNTIYPGKFELTSIGELSKFDALNSINYTKLDDARLLKYATLQYHINGNDKFLREYDSLKLYDQYYQVKQHYNTSTGEYEGPFVCLIRFGRTIIEVSGTEGDINLVVNQPNITEILHGMKMFVDRNFPYHKYHLYTQWAKSSFWNNKMKLASCFLTSYNLSTTLITMNASKTSVPLRIQPNLRFPDVIAETHALGFKVDENLRVVTKITTDSEVKVGSISQNMFCSLYKQMSVMPNYVDKLSNQELLETGIILQLVTKRYASCSMNNIIKIFNTRIGCRNASVLMSFYKSLLHNFGLPNVMPCQVDQDDYDVDIEEIYLEKELPEGAMALMEMTEPEDLSFITREYQHEDIVEIKRLTAHGSIRRTLAKIYCNQLTHPELVEVVHKLAHDSVISREMIALLDMMPAQFNDELVTLENMVDDMEVDDEIMFFILGNDLDKESFWQNVDMLDLLNKDLYYSSPRAYIWYQKIKKAICEQILCLEEQDNTERLKDLLMRSRMSR